MYPMELRSWWEVAFLLLFVILAGISDIHPAWSRWFAPVIYGVLGAAFIVYTYKFLRQ